MVLGSVLVGRWADEKERKRSQVINFGKVCKLKLNPLVTCRIILYVRKQKFSLNSKYAKNISFQLKGTFSEVW